MGLRLTYPLGATPLDPDEAEGLIPRHISTQGQLNEWELQNILEGQQWAFTRRPANLLTIDFMQSLHRRMFGNTWHWAGTLRITEKSIGVAPEFISVRLRDLCDDIGAQQEYRSFPPREIAARFHHRLVFIHPFPNGNGRFSRLMTDLLLEEFGEPPFTWGEGDLIADGEVRSRYIAALRAADARDYGPLLNFLSPSG